MISVFDTGEMDVKSFSKIMLMESWAKKIKEYTLGRMASGHELEGFKLVNGPSRRTWKSPSDARAEFEEIGIDCDYRKMLSAPALLKEYKKNYEYTEIINKHVGMTKPNLIIAKNSDKRKAVSINSGLK